MNMQHKTIIVTVFILCLVLLAGCLAKPNKEPDFTKEYSLEESDSTKEYSLEEFDSTKEYSLEEPATYISSSHFSNAAGTSIDVLREEMVKLPSEPAVFGMAYLGYFEYIEETGIDFNQWFYHAAAPLAEYYPFITEIDEAHTIGTEGHLYCVIAQDYASSISVNSIENGELLYQSENGDPILIFCNLDGDAAKADTVVTIKTVDGNEYQWEPMLDNMGFPNILVGDERRLLSYDLGNVLFDTGFDAEDWLANGWCGPTAAGLAYDDYGTNWWVSTWDNSISYCLSFYLIESENDSYDGEVVLECFYAGDSTVQAQWQGWWRIETEMEQPSRLYLDLMLLNGADMAAFENASVVSESYLAMVPLSEDYLLLVADDVGTALPIFPEGAQTVELTLGAG